MHMLSQKSYPATTSFKKCSQGKKKKKKVRCIPFKTAKNNIFSFPPTNELTDPDDILLINCLRNSVTLYAGK